MKIKKVAILGGGTAGWLAANHLGLEVGRDSEVEITLIESPDIPPIGVGEGTVPNIRASLKELGISELDLISRCHTTFKMGVKFSGWMDAQKHGLDHFYYNPFGGPFPSGFDVTHYWLNNRSSLALSELSNVHHLAELNRCPKLKSSPPYSGPAHYAYHFDAGKFSELLADNAKEKFPVRHIHETVSRVLMNDDGSIKGFGYASGAEEEFDFYIDCTGFAALLIDKALGVPFVDKSSQILTDTALVYQVPTQETDELQPYTSATAHKAGWIWDIPLTHRRGTGFVYSSSHMDETEALKTFSGYLGKDMENENVREKIRKVPMKVGYRKNFWEKNCVALGLAQGFVEPLEATSIMVTDFTASMIAKHFPREREDIPLLSKHCNSWVEYIWERTIDFIQLHYCISDRRDSDFWVDCTENAPVSALLSERLERWKLAPPKRTDFFSTVDLFSQESFMYVLYGMNYPTRPPALSRAEIPRAEAKIREHMGWCEKAAESLMTQRAWHNELGAALMQKSS